MTILKRARRTRDPGILGGEPADYRTWEAPLNMSGVSQLPRALTINGQTVQPTLAFKGQDATLAEWKAEIGTDLAITGTGDDPVLGRPTPYLDDTKAVLFGGRHYQAAAASFGDIGTDDFVFEAVIRRTPTQSGQIADKRIRPGPPNDGWSFAQSTNAGQMIASIDPQGGGSQNWSVNSGDSGWIHIIAFVDRDESSAADSSRMFNNSVEGTGIDLSAQAGSLDSSALFTLGARTNDAGKFDGELAWFALWRFPSWFSGTNLAAWQVAAAERYERLCGLRPTIDDGDAFTSILRTHASKSYVDVQRAGDTRRRLYEIGINGSRVAQRRDRTGKYVAGYLAEPSRTNAITSSEDFNAGGWSLSNVTARKSANVLAPDGNPASEILAAGTGNLTRQIFASEASLEMFSLWAKAGLWDYLALRGNGSNTAILSFDIRNGRVASTHPPGGDVIGGIVEDWGDGWFRLHFTMKNPTASTYIYPAPADLVVGGTAPDEETPLVYLFGVQREDVIAGVAATAAQVASSYVRTAGSTATRLADRLEYDVAMPNNRGAVEVNVLLEDFDYEGLAGSDLTVAQLTELGNEATDYANLALDNANDSVQAEGSGGTSSWLLTPASPDVIDGKERALIHTWEPGDIRAYVDGAVAASAGGGVVPPATLDRLSVGSNRTTGGSNQLEGLINGVTLYKEPRKP